MKHQRLSAVFVAVSTASLLMVSTAGFAAHKTTHHKAAAVAAEHENYKGEANFKAEVPPPCPPIMMLHDGFYVGAGVGYDSYKIDRSGSISAIVAPATTGFSGTSSSDLNATGWMGGIFAGYGHYFDWFYLGAEINANTSGADTSVSYSDTNNDSATSRFKARASYGIALLPGIKVNDSTLLYARLGYLRSDFRVRTWANSGTYGTSAYASDNDWRNGFDYGVGLETYVAENVSVRGEYTHTQFRSDSANGSFVAPYNATTVQYSVNERTKLSNNEFMLSLLYHFA